ncbi:MAG: beta-phosphoglucomutase family hydrolase [Desulfovibrionaceae bacterium]|nr:beta-phosphoglucomutase family hydrolase [Desulfovibrionaceae bacterium]
MAAQTPKACLGGVIFDLDGVITRTAKVHAMSWKTMFDEFLKKRSERENKPFVPFDRGDDYLNYVDGKPRFEGVLSFLKSRNIRLPYGKTDDPPDKMTVCGLGNRKNDLFRDVLRREGPEVFESSVSFIKALKARGVSVGVATSSKNCRLVLQLAGLEDLFQTRVDGLVSEELGLKGKPEPDIFVTAARNLGLSPGECVVVEDAISGVQAGRNGNFGLVLGVARNIQGELLRRFGADQVVQDLSEFTLQDLDDWFARGIEDDAWTLTYNGLDPGDEKLRETLTAVGNGFLGTRGCFEGERASFFYYPGAYIAGVYNRLASTVQGREIWNNDLVNCPNWLPVEFRIGNGGYVSPLSLELLSYSQTLDMRQGVMSRSMVCRDKLGRITRVHSRRLASMADPHVCALRYDLTPCNYSAPVTFRSSLDGNVINDGVARYRQLSSQHLCRVAGGAAGGGAYLEVETTTSKRHIAMAAKTAVLENGREIQAARSVSQDRMCVMEEAAFFAHENNVYSLEKFVAVHTSLDTDKASLRSTALTTLSGVSTFRGVHSPHVRAWKALWDKADFRITGDRFVQRVLRLHIYHLLVTASPHNPDIDAGMPARGLHGEAYRGHVFWDEIYIMPFYDHHLPETSRALLMYRYRRLAAARRYAADNGHKGAMYPWQTADDGSEETQEVHFNPESRTWGPDLSRRQRHVSIAVFYNLWKYVNNCGDKAFLRDCGAEMMIEIARFWADIAVLDPQTGRYHISGVMGPDEFHEKLPDSDEPGITDNAYTNIMVVWLMERVLELVEDLSPAVRARLKKTGFGMTETEKWRDMTRRMNVVLGKAGIISQFEGYMDLEELDWAYYRKKYYSIQRMDRILKARGDSPDRYKVAKQADVLMTFYVLPPAEVRRILRQLGYKVGNAMKLLLDNYKYYVKRTSHGSTLSKVVHAIISSYVLPGDTAWAWFMEAMRSDVFDTQGGTTIEGVHCGVMAGTVDVVIRYFAGLDLSGEVPEINPQIPAHWGALCFKLCHRRVWYNFEFTRTALRIGVKGKGDRPIRLRVLGRDISLAPGEGREISLVDA